MVKKLMLLSSIFMLTACSHFVDKSENADDKNRYFADASECYQTAQRKEKVNVTLSGNKDHSFAFPVTIDIPITYDAGAFKNCMIYAGHSAPKTDVDPTAYMEISRRCLDQARGEANSNEVYATCIRNGDISVEAIDTRKEILKNK